MKQTAAMEAGSKGFMSRLGPGLLYAGAAIGVSHLVQSTKAGALYGFSLVVVVVLANVIKYPFFEAGPRYATATGESLIEGYKRLGTPALAIFVLLTLATMLAVQAAVTIVTAGLGIYILRALGVTAELPAAAVSAGLLLVCAAILMPGRYSLLDKVMKVIIIILSVTTVLALVLTFFGEVPKSEAHMVPFDWTDQAAIVAFIIPLVGWMPAPIDIAIWHSVWTLEKKKESGGKLSMRESLFDFRIGYWGTTALAVFFVALGAMVLYGTGTKLEPKAGAFARQVIDMYALALGDWSRPLIALAAFTTMFSTTLTCFDAFGRVLGRSTGLVVPAWSQTEGQRKSYWGWLGVVGVGTIVVLGFFTESMAAMVTFATTASFLTAPVLALFNHMALQSKHMPEHARPRGLLKAQSVFGLVFLFAFAGFYLYTLFL